MASILHFEGQIPVPDLKGDWNEHPAFVQDEVVFPCLKRKTEIAHVDLHQFLQILVLDRGRALYFGESLVSGKRIVLRPLVLRIIGIGPSVRRIERRTVFLFSPCNHFRESSPSGSMKKGILFVRA